MSDELQNTDSNQKTRRNEHPSGWLVLTKNESVPYIVDALLDAPPHREFNQTELAELAGVSRQSVSRYLDLLVDVGIVESLDGTSPQRYRFDPESHVSEALIRLDGAMNAAGTDLETSS
jgi:Fic family protein